MARPKNVIKEVVEIDPDTYKVSLVGSSSVKTIIRNKDGGYDEVTLNRNTAIKRFCAECMGFAPKEVIYCTSKFCPLFSFKMGGSPGANLKKMESAEGRIEAKKEKIASKVAKKRTSKKDIV